MRNFNRFTSRQSVSSSNVSGNRHYSKSYSSYTQNSSSSYQQAVVNINHENLVKPYILMVKVSCTQLTGQVNINGRVIKQLNNNNNQFNLSPYLLFGKNIIEVSASYSPRLSLIEVAFLGIDSKIVQHTRGSGELKYTLIVVVE